MLMLHAAPSRSAMLAMNRSWAVLAISGFGTALFVAVAAYAVPRYGPIGGNLAHVMLGVVTAVLLDVAWLRRARVRPVPGSTGRARAGGDRAGTFPSPTTHTTKHSGG